MKEKREKQRREQIEKYWEEHREERIALESKKSDLFEKVSLLTKQRGELNEKALIAELNVEVSNLTQEKKLIELFQD